MNPRYDAGYNVRDAGALLHQKLLLLKNLDSMLDFAKSTIQLEVLLFLGSKGRALTAREISEGLKIKYKSVYDALLKLINKGLVKRIGSTYELTNKGNEYVRSLRALFKGQPQYFDEALYAGMEASKLSELRITIKNMLIAKKLYDIILALGLAPNHELVLSTLARSLGLSKERAKSYLDLFANISDPQVNLFKKYVVRGGSKSSGETVKYRLSELGMRELSRIHEYRKIKRNPLLLTLMRIFRCYSELPVIKIFYPLTYSITVALTLLGLFTGQFVPLVVWVIIALVLSLTLIK